MLKAVAASVRFFTMSAIKKPEVVFILGGPGSGKGTLCRYIVENYGYVHLSAGDLLREERARPESDVGQLIESYIASGRIVPVEITCNLLDRAIQKSTNEHNRFLIDGFPRNRDNVDGWNKAMSDKFILKGVLLCECSTELCTQRCLKRGAMGSGRIDDNEDVLIKRHESYMTDTMPIIEYYEKQGLVYKLNSMQTPEKVFEDVTKIFPIIGW